MQNVQILDKAVRLSSHYNILSHSASYICDSNKSILCKIIISGSKIKLINKILLIISEHSLIDMQFILEEMLMEIEVVKMKIQL